MLGTRVKYAVTFVAGMVFGAILTMSFDSFSQELAPDGTWVDSDPRLAPDGSWVGGEPRLAPDGSWVGSDPC